MRLKKIMPLLHDVAIERVRQHEKWGEQSNPNGTGDILQVEAADAARYACDTAFGQGRGTWRHILTEEVFEAFAEADPDRLRTELIQVAAVAVAWVEDLDRYEEAAAHGEELIAA